MKRVFLIGLVGVCVVLAVFHLATTASAQSTPMVRISESEARDFAAQAATAANAKETGKEATFNRTFRDLVRTRVPKYQEGAVWVYWNRGLNVYVSGRVAEFQRRAWEEIRTLRAKPALDEVTWPSGPIVRVDTVQMTAPRIERVVINRGGAIIEPTINEMLDTEAKNLLGAIFPSREGALFFDYEVFEPSKRVGVRLILIPQTGQNIEISLNDYMLTRVFGG